MRKTMPNIYDDGHFTVGGDNLLEESLFEKNLKIQKRKICYQRIMGITCFICTNCVSFMMGVLIYKNYDEMLGSFSC